MPPSLGWFRLRVRGHGARRQGNYFDGAMTYKVTLPGLVVVASVESPPQQREAIDMRKVLIAAAMIALASAAPARSQTVIDGSDAGLSATDLAAFRQTFSRFIPDPYSAQVKDLKLQNDRLCGNVNAKGKSGRYVGFRPFGLLLSKRQIVVAPAVDESDLSHLPSGDRVLERRLLLGERRAYLDICG